MSLAYFVAHEIELFAGAGHLVGQQQTQIGEFLPRITGHFTEQRTFAVHDFIMRKRQHEIFSVSI